MITQDKIYEALKKREQRLEKENWVKIEVKPRQFKHYGKPCIIQEDGRIAQWT